MVPSSSPLDYDVEQVYYPEVAEDGDPYLTSSSSQTTDDASTKVSEATSSQVDFLRRAVNLL